MSFALDLKSHVFDVMQELYPDKGITEQMINISPVNADFDGDYAVVLFPFLKLLSTKPADLGEVLGNALLSSQSWVEKFQVVGGYLNLTISQLKVVDFLNDHFNKPQSRINNPTGKKVMVEYSSPNTNKPLHFGHLRNIFLGFSMSRILKEVGHEVIKANLINDRGVHICKSMLAWQRLGNGETPQSSGMKGDHLVGKYYVLFNNLLKEEISELVASGQTEEEAAKNAPILQEVQSMLKDWEDGKEDVVNLWKTMNGWVYEGFDVSYKNLGVDFDKYYYESDTYLLGKDVVNKGLEKGVLFKKEDGSVWIDLTNEGLDQKLLLRKDGTSVYMTQDIGTAILKYNDFKMDTSVYVIADEQNYHMQVLKLCLEKLGEPAANGIFHLSYGMVELPTGRLKSREGTTVDADDMMKEMKLLAKAETESAGKTEGFTDDELNALYETIGMGALKFYLLRVDPKKKMIFNPKESIDLHGFTAAFIQYAHARINSILRKENSDLSIIHTSQPLTKLERDLILCIETFGSVVQNAAQTYNPSLIANYAFQLAQMFNSFYDKHSISKAESDEKKQLRLAIITLVKNVLARSMYLLGVQVPDRM